MGTAISAPMGYHFPCTIFENLHGKDDVFMDHKKIERISELTRISRVRQLTHEELEEREALRREYLDGFRQNAQALLESVCLKRPDGTIESLKKKQDKH